MRKKAPIEIGDILGMSLSPGGDQALIIHCAVRVCMYMYIGAYNSVQRVKIYSLPLPRKCIDNLRGGGKKVYQLAR